MRADFNPLGLVVLLAVLALVYFFRRREATSVRDGFRAMGSMDAHVVGLAKVVGTIGPTTITYVIVQGGKNSPGATTLTTPTPTGMPPFEMHLSAQGARDARLVERGLEVDICVGDPVFDASVVIEAAPSDLACASLDPQTRALVMQAMPCTVDVADGVLRLHKSGKVTNPSAAAALLATVVQLRAGLSTLTTGFTTNDGELAQLRAVRSRRMRPTRIFGYAVRAIWFAAFVGTIAYAYFGASRRHASSHDKTSAKTSPTGAKVQAQAAATSDALSESDEKIAMAAARAFRFDDGSYPRVDVDDPQKKVLTDRPALLYYLASRKDDPKARAGAVNLIAYQRQLDAEALRTLTEHLADPTENDAVLANLASAAWVVETPDEKLDEALRTVCREHRRAVVRGYACVALANRHRPLPASAEDAKTSALVGACGDEAIVLQELATFYDPVPDVVFDAALRRVDAKEPEAVRFYALRLLSTWATGGLTPQQIDRLLPVLTPVLSDTHPALRAIAASALVAPPGRWRLVQRVLPLLTDAAKPKLSLQYEAVTFDGPVQRTQDDAAGGSAAYVTDDDADTVWKVVTDALVSKSCGDVDEIGTAERWHAPTTRTHATFLAAWRSWYARNASHLPMDGPGGG